jgi:hypothetical protein
VLGCRWPIVRRFAVGLPQAKPGAAAKDAPQHQSAAQRLLWLAA